MQTSRSFFSLVLACLAFCRVILPLNYNLKDVLLHVAWITSGFISTIVMVFNDIYILDLKHVDPQELSYICSDLFGILMTTFPYPTMAYFVIKNDYLLRDKNLGKPIQFFLFLAAVILQIISLGYG